MRNHPCKINLASVAHDYTPQRMLRRIQIQVIDLHLLLIVVPQKQPVIGHNPCCPFVSIYFFNRNNLLLSQINQLQKIGAVPGIIGVTVIFFYLKKESPLPGIRNGDVLNRFFNRKDNPVFLVRLRAEVIKQETAHLAEADRVRLNHRQIRAPAADVIHRPPEVVVHVDLPFRKGDDRNSVGIVVRAHGIVLRHGKQ